MCSRRITYLFFILSILATSCTKVVREYYPNGRLMSEIHYRFGKEHGMMTYFNEHYGGKSLEVNMKNGKKNGKLTRYFFNGNLEAVAYYINDVIDGQELIYDMNGALILETNYKSGVKDGPYFSWHTKGMHKEIGAFLDGNFHGKWEYYDDRGCMVGEAAFDNGSGIQITYNPHGGLARKTTYENNLKNGEEIYYTSSGEVEKVIVFKDDKIIEVNGVKVIK